VIDLHTHLLHGLDDGPSSLDGSLDLARAALAGGTQVITATPHIDLHYGVSEDLIRARVYEIRSALADEGLPIKVALGGEIALDAAMERGPRDLAPFVLGDGRWLLLECPFTFAVPFLEKVVFDLRAHGYGVLLAHPERAPALQQDLERVRALVAAGAMTQITAGSLAGAFGSTVAGFAKALVREGLAHVVASDAHDHERRPPDMRPGLDACGLAQAEREWLVRDVPAAVLAGREIPPAPAAPPERESLRQRLRARRA
jgi:protein-tyrosine phosphatase